VRDEGLSLLGARQLLAGLIAGGLTRLVVCPGSRNAPLVYAAAEAEAAGVISLNVRVDERVGGFLALGLAKGDVGGLVGVVCTSGTATANLHPAVLEAAHSETPLLVITADRPAEAHGVGANQTVEQRDLYGRAVRWSRSLRAPDSVKEARGWERVGVAACAAARGARSAWPGPVHLNVSLREPLVPAELGAWPVADAAGITGAGVGQALAAGAGSAGTGNAGAGRIEPKTKVTLARGSRTLVIAGAGAGPGAEQLARGGGWPLLAEPASGAWFGPNAVRCGRYVLESGRFAEQIEHVIVCGRPTLTRTVSALVSNPGAGVIVVRSSGGPWFDLGRAAQMVVDEVLVDAPGAALGPDAAAPNPWLQEWLAAGAAAGAVVDTQIEQNPEPTGIGVAAALIGAAAARGDTVMLGASSAVRAMDIAPIPANPAAGIHANRGVAGIDGTIATASGLAIAGHSGRVQALIGDLTALHDAGALAVPVAERAPNVRVVVLNDGGGGIFEALEQGRAPLRTVFERFFAAGMGVHFRELAAAFGASYHLVNRASQLPGSVARDIDGFEFVVVRIARTGRRERDEELARAAIGVITAR
jgi:2-succinyl-5-enolpyruvyl-6-hydroxy-3-cyclohexene-1-carboxylate synthase